jgi:hypothetical protein
MYSLFNNPHHITILFPFYSEENDLMNLVGFVVLQSNQASPNDFQALALLKPEAQKKGIVSHFVTIFNKLAASDTLRNPVNSIFYEFRASNTPMRIISAKIQGANGVTTDYFTDARMPCITIPIQSFKQVAQLLQANHQSK